MINAGLMNRIFFLNFPWPGILDRQHSFQWTIAWGNDEINFMKMNNRLKIGFFLLTDKVTVSSVKSAWGLIEFVKRLSIKSDEREKNYLWKYKEMRKSSEINEYNDKDEKLNGKCPADTVFVRIDGNGHMFICSLLICLLVISTHLFFIFLLCLFSWCAKERRSVIDTKDTKKFLIRFFIFFLRWNMK